MKKLVIFSVCFWNICFSNEVSNIQIPPVIKKLINQQETKIVFKNYLSLNKDCRDFKESFQYGEYRKKENIIYLNIGIKKCPQVLEKTLYHELFHFYVDVNKVDLSSPSLRLLSFRSVNNKLKNKYPKRSPDVYEYHSVEEFLAVNFEYFMTDKNYRCKRPQLYNYFSNLFNLDPFKALCKINYKIPFNNRIVDINPHNIAEIHYLFAQAGKNSTIFSKWGHGLLRIVLCDKEDNVIDCREDETKNVIVGFLAQVDEQRINVLKGITGGYKSQIAFLTLGEVRAQYNFKELRNLISIPLNLKAKEKERFIHYFLRTYWEYSGKYAFFTNNCADEAFRILQYSFNKDKYYKERILTPLGIFKLLREKKLDKNQMKKDFLYYESSERIYNLAFEKLRLKFPEVFTKKNSSYSHLKRNERKPHTFKEIDNLENFFKLGEKHTHKIVKELQQNINTKEDVLNLFNVVSYLTNKTREKYTQLINEAIIQRTKDSQHKDYFWLKDLISEKIHISNMIRFQSHKLRDDYGIPVNMRDIQNQSANISHLLQRSIEIDFEIKSYKEQEFSLLLSEYRKYKKIKLHLAVMLNDLRRDL